MGKVSHIDLNKKNHMIKLSEDAQKSFNMVMNCHEMTEDENINNGIKGIIIELTVDLNAELVKSINSEELITREEYKNQLMVKYNNDKLEVLRFLCNELNNRY